MTAGTSTASTSSIPSTLDGNEGRRHRRPQRLLLCPRPRQRQVHPRLARSSRRSLGRRDWTTMAVRSTSENRPGDPTRIRPMARRARRCSRCRASSAARTRCRWPISPDTKLFYVPSNEWGMDIRNEPVDLQEGRGLPRRGLHHQAHLRRPHRLAEGDRSRIRQDRLGGQEHGPAVGWRSDDRPAALSFFGNARRRLERRSTRKTGEGAVEVQHRIGHRRLADHLGSRTASR